LVDEILGCRDGTPVEGGDSARERVDEVVRFGVGKCPVDVSVSLRGVAPSRVFSRDAKGISQARTNSLLTPRTQPRIYAMVTTGDLVRRTNVSVRIGRPEGPTAAFLPGQIKVGKVELRIRALEYHDT
jgi:hypothetical protein